MLAEYGYSPFKAIVCIIVVHLATGSPHAQVYSPPGGVNKFGFDLCYDVDTAFLSHFRPQRNKSMIFSKFLNFIV